MAEYIEREKAKEMFYSGHTIQSLCERGANTLGEAFSIILDEVPAADVRPVVRGRWISHDFVDMGKGRYTGSVECSVCHRFLPTKENFCPTCGAMMEES